MKAAKIMLVGLLATTGFLFGIVSPALWVIDSAMPKSPVELMQMQPTPLSTPYVENLPVQEDPHEDLSWGRPGGCPCCSGKH